MRILLDESVPSHLGPLLVGHQTTTVQRRGWSSIQNGELLRRAALDFDVLITADNGIEHQQNPRALPVASAQDLRHRRATCPPIDCCARARRSRHHSP